MRNCIDNFFVQRKAALSNDDDNSAFGPSYPCNCLYKRNFHRCNLADKHMDRFMFGTWRNSRSYNPFNTENDFRLNKIKRLLFLQPLYFIRNIRFNLFFALKINCLKGRELTLFLASLMNFLLSASIILPFRV